MGTHKGWCKALAALIAAILLAVPAGPVRAQGANDYRYLPRVDGGVEVRFAGGCLISYDRRGTQIGQLGPCDNRHAAWGIDAAYAYLGLNGAPAGNAGGTGGGRMGPQVTDRVGGGAEVRFSNGCAIAYDTNARRDGQFGTCTADQFSRADREAFRFLGGRPAAQDGQGGGRDGPDSAPAARGPEIWRVSGVGANGRLNLRAAPSRDARVIGQARENDRLRNLGCTVAQSGRTWCRVRQIGGAGITGFAVRAFLQPDAGQAPAPRPPVVAPAPPPQQVPSGPAIWQVGDLPDGQRMEIRARPTINSPVVTFVPVGAQLRNLGCEITGRQVWCRVQTLSGPPVTGYATDRFLREVAAPRPGGTMPSDLVGLEGRPVLQVAPELLARGYRQRRSEGRSVFWLNLNTGMCARVDMAEGLVQALRAVPAALCR
ncbi:MAG: SH3 domain-containing protein [Rhodobacteraceae bacterium]|nr:SH3 domain-containing protein [Paracoccaceae bacterium]